MRTGEYARSTTETKIKIKLNIDGKGLFTCKTGIGFLDHMLELMARHGRFDAEITANGDVEVDYHHTVEDLGIALGKAFSDALGDMCGVTRYGSFMLPMDESLIIVALDFSGRPCLCYDLQVPAQKVGDFDTELVREFFAGFCNSAGLTLHLKQLAGINSHHIIEAAFKGFGRALRQAVALDDKFSGEIPSTKGLLKN
ncbi:MAG: imidazoleglycerol-phosphate dehydratase HisB [Oscillospiraceae bacterium]|nr:imidazoleglycerol-phosphate dehydratase HisB [Oscillospiraceae bacterium]